jgi:Putative zinc-finger
MSHYDQQVWERYLRGEITGETAAVLEEHLYECDNCLESYTIYLELHSSSIPAPLEDDVLTKNILTAVYGSNADLMDQQIDDPPIVEPTPVRVDRWRTLRNYAIASAATIILVVTGTFNGLFKQVDDLKSRTAARESSVSEKLVDKTVTFLDGIHHKNNK